MTNLIFTTLLFLSFGGYLVTNKRTYRYSYESWIDSHVSLAPLFVVFYSLYFPLILFTYLATIQGPWHTSFLISMLTANILANVIWLMFPNGVKRPIIETKTVWMKILKFIYTHDGDRNGFPSGHVFLTLVCTYYLVLEINDWWWLWSTLGIGISLSTIFTKQHYVLDIVGGILVALASLMLTDIWSGIALLPFAGY